MKVVMGKGKLSELRWFAHRGSSPTSQRSLRIAARYTVGDEVLRETKSVSVKIKVQTALTEHVDEKFTVPQFAATQ